MTFRRMTIALVLLAASIVTACGGHRHYEVGGGSYGGYVRTAPPPLRYERYGPASGRGLVWVPGYWAWRPSGGWSWRGGTWMRPPRPHAVWVPGMWQHHGGRGYGWRPGFWR